jgi:hypothetical protein
MVIRLNCDAIDKLRRLCHSLGREHERPGSEYTPVQMGEEEAVRADRARLLAAKRRRISAALGNALARTGGAG